MKISTTVSLDGELLEGARAFARSERRSLSAQIEAWIEEKLTSDAPESIARHPVPASLAARENAEPPHHLVPDPNADIARRPVVRVPDKPITKATKE